MNIKQINSQLFILNAIKLENLNYYLKTIKNNRKTNEIKFNNNIIDN
jgi:hypothetical protein